ncbi:FUN14 domain-containing protein 1-like [Coccinella septempunctata]|uniref:FUN14 domain-containing protein 1-like n=1 Tax=Coccinella septempunctata TaxID=41139 RepID=UPI001D094EA2|nr:FUN14 domain-containing protein 1-like [Coccinella septempunctata]
MYLKSIMGDANEAIIDKIFDNINASHPDCQLAVAAMTGYIYGVIMTKIGKTLALATGGGIILLQLANNHGIITIHYNKIAIPRNAAYMRNSVGDSFCHAIDSIYTFAKTNTVFSIGFIGGMLVGVGSCL